MKIIAQVIFSLCFVIPSGYGITQTENNTKILNSFLHEYLSKSNELSSLQAVVVTSDQKLYLYPDAYSFLDEMPRLEIFSVNGCRLKSPTNPESKIEYSSLLITIKDQEISFEFPSIFIDSETNGLLILTTGSQKKGTTFRISNDGTVQEVNN